MRQVSLFVPLIAVIAIAAAGCQRAAQSPEHQMADGGTAQVVNVVAKEFAFEPKEIRVNAGMAKFVVRNEGAVEHDFEIVGAAEHGAEHESRLIQPRGVYEVQVPLNPGTYQVVCNVPGHKDASLSLKYTSCGHASRG